MKKTLILSSIIAIILTFYHCSSENIIDSEKEDLKSEVNFLNQELLSKLSENYAILPSMLDLKDITEITQGDFILKSIPILKDGEKTGWVRCLIKDNLVERFFYEDISELRSGKTKGYTYIYNESQLLVVYEFEWNKEIKDKLEIYRIYGVNENATVDSNLRSERGYLDCVADTYKEGKDACDSDSKCKLMCDAADIFGGSCSGSMMIAAAAHCVVND